ELYRDSASQRRRQTSLMQTEKMAGLGQLISSIAHELNNPLNGMSLTVQLLEQRLARPSNPLADDQATATVKRLKDEISRLNQLAGEFRAISRKERYDFRPADLAPIIEDIVGMQAPHFAGHGIEIKSSMPADLPPVKVDEDKIKQALLNLVKNAAEAMPGGGRISIGAALTDDAVALEIADTGTGIPLDVDAFEPFATTKKGGTGLGLVIVRQIITAHGGKISYRSRPGEGTTFRIDLPLSKSD
ncbi:MAG TPA: ATP-binding protein, partial [Candidatus Acidoferrales bacterium]|nr:ATP-binding protein [Candidatus Acidoferrales bacterium]